MISKKTKTIVIACAVVFVFAGGIYWDHTARLQHEAAVAAILEKEKEEKELKEQQEADARLEAKEQRLEKACPWGGNIWKDEMPKKVEDCRRKYHQARMTFQSIICYSGGVVILDNPKVFHGISQYSSRPATWVFYPNHDSKYSTGRGRTTVSGQCVIKDHAAEISE